ncbi:hypothetical protein AMS68_002820 [Peltaster fructicola]|uniref:Uncharacterized protein n=1 Tax=Peltaster fructicola TaxID=286661 RepID=A0A6H0XRH2_9PEZI|nr:hypothetical protein AMS68_002820 [Peltaster fructicola]
MLRHIRSLNFGLMEAHQCFRLIPTNPISVSAQTLSSLPLHNIPSHVRAMVIGCLTRGFTSDAEGEYQIDEAKRISEVDGLSEYNKLVAVEDYTRDAVLALLLASCPEVTSLELDVDFIHDTLTGDLLRTAQVQPTAFRHLGEVSLILQPGLPAMQTMGLILRLPALHTFRGQHVDLMRPTRPSPRYSSTVRRIYLSASSVRPDYWETFLTSCPALEVLCLDWHDLWAEVYTGLMTNTLPSFSWPMLGEPLRNMNQLHTFALTTGSNDAKGWARFCLGDSMGSLAILPLKQLDVPMEALFGCLSKDNLPAALVDILPCTLEALTISDDMELHDKNDHMCERLHQLMSDDQFRALSVISLSQNHPLSSNYIPNGWTQAADAARRPEWLMDRRHEEPLLVVRRTQTV